MARGIVLWLLVRTGRTIPEKRISLLARAKKLAGPRLVLCLDLASELQNQGETAQAEATFAQAAALDAQHLGAHIGRVECCLQRGKRQRAQ
ncbi:MAG: hypothetical protein ABGW82_12665, partial [Paracoccus sp. (in: a-proteobacteria)]